MESELKILLSQLLVKLDGIDARLKEVERKAHDQVTPLQIYPFQPKLPQPLDWQKAIQAGAPIGAMAIC